MRREAEAWSSIDLLLRGIDAESMATPDVNDDGWTVKDVVWHLAFWCEAAADVLDAIRAGSWGGIDPTREPGWIDRRNGTELERSRSMDATTILRAWRDGRRRMLEAFGALEEVTPDADEWFEESGAGHDAEHLPELARWVARHRSEATEIPGPGRAPP